MADTEARPTTNGSNGDSGGGGADSDDEQVSVFGENWFVFLRKFLSTI